MTIMAIEGAENRNLILFRITLETLMHTKPMETGTSKKACKKKKAKGESDRPAVSWSEVIKHTLEEKSNRKSG